MVGRKEDLEDAIKTLRHVYNVLLTEYEDIEDEAKRMGECAKYMRWDDDDAKWHAERLFDLAEEVGKVRRFLEKESSNGNNQN